MGMRRLFFKCFAATPARGRNSEGAAHYTLAGVPGEPIEYGSWCDHARIRDRDRAHAAGRAHRLRRIEPRPLAAHPVRHHVDRPAVLLQRRADPGARDGRRGQRRPRRRRHHEIRRSPRALVVPLGVAGHLVHGRLVPGSLRKLCRRLHARPGRHGQLLPVDHRHRRLARHDHAVQRLGADLAEPEEDPRHRRRHGRREGTGSQGRHARVADQLRAVDPMLLCMGSATHGLPF